jgi:hypothetical protein
MEEKGAYLLKNVVQHFGLLPVLADPRPFYYGALALQSVPMQMWAGLAQASSRCGTSVQSPRRYGRGELLTVRHAHGKEQWRSMRWARLGGMRCA